MNWLALTVEWSKQAKRDLRGLTAKDVAQIVGAVDLYAATGQGDMKPLTGRPEYRLRVRGRRVICSILWTGKTLVVLEVTTRGDAY